MWLFAAHVASPLHADLVPRESDGASPEKFAGSSGFPPGAALAGATLYDFQERVRAVPSNTILHVPQRCRLQMIPVVARCWNGLATGSDEYALAARLNLLLVLVLGRTAPADEVSKRVEL